jgi:SAM-dependent methyltransferase
LLLEETVNNCISDSAVQEHTVKPLAREEIIDVHAVDWNRAWRARRALKTSPKRNAHFWDGRAASFAKATKESDYAGRFLAIMKPEAHWTVLDMGCGSGTLAIPLARAVSSVTAVDLSAEMLAIVGTRCKDEGINNVATLRGQWEDDWSELGIGTHDVAIASRSMVVDNLHASILKLDSVARKRVYVATIVGDGPYDRRLFEAIGRPLDLGPDYIYNYNLLYQMGILANVAFIEETRSRTYKSTDEAFASVQWMFDDLNPSEAKKLRAFVENHLVTRNGHSEFSYDRVVRWAVIWWEKQ